MGKGQRIIYLNGSYIWVNDETLQMIVAGSYRGGEQGEEGAQGDPFRRGVGRVCYQVDR